MTDIEIVPFSQELAPHFTSLNTHWLQKYFVIEPVDRLMLGDPQQFFIDKGGFIFFARANGQVAGTFALLKETDSVYELSKMAVSEAFQGRAIGNRMMRFCIEKCRELGIRKLILYSNTLLKPAIHLYRKYGFVEVPVTNSVYKRSDIKMELVIQ
jgi:ribosomal protein S18 acetylase RimI-like enzyme